VEKLVFLNSLPEWIVEAKLATVGLGIPVVLGIVAFPVLLALLSRSPLAVLASSWLSAASLILLLGDETATAATMAVALVGGSLIVAFGGFIWHRPARELRTECDLLRARIRRLEAAEERKVLVGVQSNVQPTVESPSLQASADKLVSKRRRRTTKENGSAPETYSS
jgi:hypothetical protein